MRADSVPVTPAARAGALPARSATYANDNPLMRGTRPRQVSNLISMPGRFPLVFTVRPKKPRLP
jgi:hypothetical protein